MNRTFVVKMMQAKQLQYEAMKEIMPEKLADRFTKLESEMFDIGKEYFMAAMSAATDTNQSENEEKETPKTRKVTIE